MRYVIYEPSSSLMSSALAGVTEALCTAPLFRSTPTCTFIPKYH